MSDFCRDYADSAELHSASDKLEVYYEMGAYIAALADEGVRLAAATRAVALKTGGASQPFETHIGYVVGSDNGNLIGVHHDRSLIGGPAVCPHARHQLLSL